MGRQRARFTKKNYFSTDPTQLAMTGVRPEGETSRAPPRVLPGKPLWKRSWCRRTIKALGVVFLGTSGLAGCFAEGTRDAAREAAVSYAVTLYYRLANELPPAEGQRSSVATAPATPLPGTSPIETGSVEKQSAPAMGKRAARRRTPEQETNPILRLGMRLGEAVDEFFGYRRRE